MKTSAFQIYNASAGSGKTFTLTKAYLKVILKSKESLPFKNSLALTFTNKAVEEMKTRIVDTLREFSAEESIKKPSVMFDLLKDDLKLTAEALQQKSKIILQQIVNNYAAFNISTIDGFTHRVIRTFAKDLKLPVNFEVELDEEELLNEAVDALISRAGTDELLTDLLVNFALEKANEDKSWDIAIDLKNISKLLINENHRPFIDALSDKTIVDFQHLKHKVVSDKKGMKKQLIHYANSFFELIETHQVSKDSFSRGSIPNFFSKIQLGNFKDDFTAKWQETIAEADLYPKKVEDSIKANIDQLQPQIATLFYQVKQGIFEFQFYEALLKSITPLSVIFEINNELTLIKEDRNILLISEFNRLISQEIKDQPTPFIYERLGEKFRHYFIDEFQDTSVMQWQNTVPLIDNALSSTNGSLMLVGDAKQSIYRWRGSRAEQFIGLYEQTENPFNVESEIISLDSNYRSCQSVVNFNNGLFKFIGERFFSNDSHKNLFENSIQNTIIETEGYVQLNFIQTDTKSEMDEPYAEQVLKNIQSCLEDGFQPNDICVLVRKKKEGVALTNYLTENNINISSSETLLLKNSPKVNFLVNLLHLIDSPEDEQAKIQVLSFMSSALKLEDEHSFFETFLHKSVDELFDFLRDFQIDILLSEITKLSLYEMVETLIRAFQLTDYKVAQLQFFLDVVFEFSQRQDHSLSSFLDYFESKKEKLSVVSQADENAISLMTIHKSKGLEFPVVIFPYADLDIYKDINPKVWFPLDKEKFLGFEYMLMSINSKLENFGETGAQIWSDYLSKMELDNFNLLYVSLTRSVERLYIVSALDTDKYGQPSNRTYSGFFIHYLKHIGQWDNDKTKYDFGTKSLKQLKTKSESKVNLDYKFISNNKAENKIQIVTKSGYHWLTNRDQAIEYGNLLHLIFSKIKTVNDIDFVFDDLLNSGEIQPQQYDLLKPKVEAVVHHPELSTYFTDDFEVYNEQKILTPEGHTHIPDRIVIDQNKNAIIIDYKTGSPNEKYANQLKVYQQLLEGMNYNVTKKLLVYINEEVVVEKV